MKVKITKAKKTYWYFPHIGEVFEVKTKQQTSDIWEPSREAFLYENGNTRGYIFASDCEVITEPTICPHCKEGHYPILASEDGDVDWTKCPYCDGTGLINEPASADPGL